jgi:pyruvate,water dikinase
MNKQHGYDHVTGEWNDSLTGVYLWSSVNTREATPDVMTPFTWSSMRFGFSQTMMLPGHMPVGNICGRIYNNASVGLTVMRVFGRGNKAFNATSKELYGIDPQEAQDWDVQLIPTGVRDKLGVLGNTVQFLIKARQALRKADGFLKMNTGWCDSQGRISQGLEKAELVRWYEGDLLPHLTLGFWCMVGSTVAQSNLISRLRADLRTFASPEDTIALMSNVSTDDEVLASLGVVAGLDLLRRGQISRETYLGNYGHRGPHEIELSVPRPYEDPSWIDQQLAMLELSPGDVDSLLQAQRERFRAAKERLHKQVPQNIRRLEKVFTEAARLTRLREAVRSEVIRSLGIMRAYALRAGALTGFGDEIFFLESPEIHQLLQGQNQVADCIPVRNAAHARLVALPEFPTLIMGTFDPYEWAADPLRRSDLYDPAGRIQKRFGREIKGLAGSPGCVEGRVRILNGPEEGGLLQAGEILVATTTNVGWTPIFPRAVAVVTDVGAPLSHAAIVARELGIPAVVGCFNATSELRNGDIVRVDGGEGTVTRIRRPS